MKSPTAALLANASKIDAITARKLRGAWSSMVFDSLEWIDVKSSRAKFGHLQSRQGSQLRKNLAHMILVTPLDSH